MNLFLHYYSVAVAFVCGAPLLLTNECTLIINHTGQLQLLTHWKWGTLLLLSLNNRHFMSLISSLSLHPLLPYPYLFYAAYVIVQLPNLVSVGVFKLMGNIHTILFKKWPFSMKMKIISFWKFKNGKTIVDWHVLVKNKNETFTYL